ncbi:hypothetical protein PR202_gb00486 [Eleusine coracana subsp. coracana]|uniref:Pentatricopeptide repeat-containing protein n=1 Tax=Eleusine coracana subsp. coracana TaxID=191504 RepID=A0AAV5DTI0_ELECO|nr:hypothetical protein PR202_gb00486 [Eleusine coracana subsp. coracana]
MSPHSVRYPVLTSMARLNANQGEAEAELSVGPYWASCKRREPDCQSPEQPVGPYSVDGRTSMPADDPAQVSIPPAVSCVTSALASAGSSAAGRGVQTILVLQPLVLHPTSRSGDDVQALKLFSKMHQEGTWMSEFTLSSTLCACAAKYAISECTQLHAVAYKLALDSNTFVGTAVLDAYAKCNMMKDARLVFEKMTEKTAVTWSSLFAGLTRNGLHDEALRLFQSSQRQGMELTEFTLSAILSTCASLALTIEGKQLHAIIIKHGSHGNFFVASSLVDVYSKCGHIKKAYAVFSDMEHKNVVLWNAMIASFTKHGHPQEVMILFEKMHQAGIFPNEVTYLSVLSVCSHAGFVEEARRYFSLLMSDQTVEPNVLHYSCMVDVLGRSGNIDEAWQLIQQMPFEPTASMWGSLLGSCRNYRHTGLAQIAAEQLFKLEPENGANHVLLSDVYAASKSWENATLARMYLKDSGARTDMGTSWV